MARLMIMHITEFEICGMMLFHYYVSIDKTIYLFEKVRTSQKISSRIELLMRLLDSLDIVFNSILIIIRIMEVASEPVVAAEEVTQSDGNPFVLFILFLLTLVLHYLIPLIGTIYAEKQPRKWIAYWIILLSLNYILKPILAFCFGATGASFLHLVIGVALLYVSNQEKADLLVETGDMAVGIAGQQYENVKEKVTALLRQYKLVE